MRHKMIQKKLLSYLDNDLSDDEKQNIQRHLETCQECRDDLETLERLWQSDRPIERMAVPPFLWSRIANALKSEKRRGFFDAAEFSFSRALRPVFVVAILVLVFIGGIELGTWIDHSEFDKPMISRERTEDNFGLNYFDVLPPGSIDAWQLALTESEK